MTERLFYLCKRHNDLIGELLPEDWCGACDATKVFNSALERVIKLEKALHEIDSILKGQLPITMAVKEIAQAALKENK